ncbi:aspartate-semialdehyde dehydrogenase [Alcanivorax hongdengensis A-11-3]|uniref:Aspartate-semialdehyde dehydrogenase n=2 Tax=Alcanivorax hongdengensis TaxID=519051 RepID=L0WDJ7_9GAMM|nr:aspartate-semialdehyde dehydrogenase [Alcanivorax hongdengensis A-11-3]
MAVVGATGLVGEAIIKLLADRDVPVGELFVLASESSAGKSVHFGSRRLTVGKLEDFDFSRVELAFFAAGAQVTQDYAPRASDAGTLVVDLSPAYRYEQDVPLVVAGVNDDMLAQARERNLVACADAATVQLLQALKPLADMGPLQDVVVTQLQAASATGRRGVDQLAQQSVRLLNGLAPSEAAQAQAAFNVLPVSGQPQENGYTSEELKVVLEARRILADQSFSLQVTCVRVPVFYGHGQSVTVQGMQPLSAAQAIDLWQAAGLDVVPADDPQQLSPVALADQAPQLVLSRVRDDLDARGVISYFSVADNVRMGAALNAVRIAELLLKDYL